MSRPRFIAGAVCPQCGAMDRLQIITDDEQQRRRCVACNHEDALGSASSREPRTRLGGAAGKGSAAGAAVSPVRILDPGKSQND